MIRIGTLYAYKNDCHPTSDVIATCCHRVGHSWQFDVSAKEFSDGENCVSCLSLCWKCFLRYLIHGRILFTESAERKWMYDL
jgi:hypothetical protein